MKTKKASARKANAQGRFKHAKLLEASGKMFAQCGYEGTALRDIARVGDAHPSALIYHFGSKEKLFNEVLSHYILGNARLGCVFEPFQRADTSNPASVSVAIQETIKKILTLIHGPDGKGPYLKGLIVCLFVDGGRSANETAAGLVDTIMAPAYETIRKTVPELSESDLFWWGRMFWAMMLYPIYGEDIILSRTTEKKFSKEFIDTLALRMSKAVCPFIKLPTPEGVDTWTYTAK